MIDVQDPHRFALALIDRHGDQAAIYAAMEADERLEAGDLDRTAFHEQILYISMAQGKPGPTPGSMGKNGWKRRRLKEMACIWEGCLIWL